MTLAPAAPASVPPSVEAPAVRRHDLDAVRAFAMLLGIGLHASLSFAPMLPWAVRDGRQNGLFTLFFLAVHGFRMPLFFLVSGFFTAMLWRRRGVAGLLKNRAARIAAPLALGLVTVIPVTSGVYVWIFASGSKAADDGSLVAAVRARDAKAVEARLGDKAALSAPDPQFGVTPLGWAAMQGDVETVDLLLARGADPNAKSRDGSTPLHSAAFAGRPEVAERLLQAGADPLGRDAGGRTPTESSRAEKGLTEGILGLIGVRVGPFEEVESGREKVRALIVAKAPEAAAAATPAPADTAGGDSLVARYRRFVTGDALSIPVGAWRFHLVETPIFHHLWFLWFLCWLIPAFAAAGWCADRFGWRALPRSWVLSPARFLWLLPVTMVPQWFMGLGGPAFGPDTSIGLVPMPHLLLYYGVFFGFGALYYVADDAEGRLGRWWWLLLPVALIVMLPIGAVLGGVTAVGPLAQASYAWMMSFGVLGLFRRVLPRESRAVRYVSDSSYWLYLIHLPLVVAAQQVVRDWPLPAGLKFVGLCLAVSGVLLISYQMLVRYTWLGVLLNGRRPSRPAPA